MDEKESPRGPAIPERKPARRLSRLLRVGCLALVLSLCGSLSLLGLVLRSGPVSLGLPGGNMLKIGSDNVVVSNYSFQNGTTYFLDLDGNGVRNILQLNYLSDAHNLELVLHYASKEDEGERHLLVLPAP